MNKKKKEEKNEICGHHRISTEALQNFPVAEVLGSLTSKNLYSKYKAFCHHATTRHDTIKGPPANLCNKYSQCFVDVASKEDISFHSSVRSEKERARDRWRT